MDCERTFFLAARADRGKRETTVARCGVSFRLLAGFLLMLCGQLLAPSTSEAQPKNGDVLKVTTFDPLFKSHKANGFRPVTLSIATENGQPVASDQDFWIVQRLSREYSAIRAESVQQKKFTLKAGSSQVIVHFTAQCPGDSFTYEELFVERDGNQRYEFRGRNDFNRIERSWRNRDYGGENLNVLMIRGGDLRGTLSQSRIVDLREFQGSPSYEYEFFEGDFENSEPLESLLGLKGVLEEALPERYFLLDEYRRNFGNSPAAGPTYADAGSFLASSYNTWLSTGTPEQMPDDWAALINLDLLLISEQDLNALVPEQLVAVQRWLTAGGRLALTDCVVEQSRRRELFEKFSGPSGLESRRPRDPDWKLIREEDFSRELGKGVSTPARDKPLMGQALMASELIAKNRCPEQPLTDKTEIGKRDILFFDQAAGRVVLTPLSLQDFQPADWRGLLLAAYGNGKRGSVRSTLGGSDLGGDRLASFEVKGVGKPPYILFLALITAFSLFAGPLAYTFLYRSKRVNFLLVLVPAISLLTTLGLIMYAVLADGFQFQSLRLSFSRIDQNSQQAITLTKHAVFSGTNPRFYSSGEGEILLPARPLGRDLRQVRYSDDGGQLSANWIRARIPHQITTASVKPTSLGLKVTRKEVDGEVTIIATNELGGPLIAGLLRIEDEWYEVAALEPGKSVQAKISTLNGFRSKVSPVFERIREQTPASWLSVDQSVVGEKEEIGLGEVLERPGLIDEDLIQSGQYIAVLEEFPGASQLKTYAKYQQQLHLIHGNW